MRSSVFFCCLLLCDLGIACENTLPTCETQLRRIISYRIQAIEYAFGELEALPDKIDITFVSQPMMTTPLQRPVDVRPRASTTCRASTLRVRDNTESAAFGAHGRSIATTSTSKNFR